MATEHDDNLTLQQLISEEHDMEDARQHTRALLTQSKLAQLVMKRPPAASWYEEDHTGLYDAPTS